MKKNYIVSKANSLITARYSLTLHEQRFIASVASLISPSDSDFKDYTIKISEVAELFNLKGNSINDDLRRMTKELLSKPFEIILMDEDDKSKKNIIQMNWFSKLKYNLSEGTIECSFDPTLKPYLLGLKEHFTSYKLNNITDLKSSYSLRIYEYMKSLQHLKRKVVSLDEFRKMLALDDKYELYGHLKSQVLIPSFEEINKETDIIVSYSELKQSRKVVSLKFLIRQKRNTTEKKISLKDIIDEGRKCFIRNNHGSCGAKWETWEDKPQSICYNCEKFKVFRGQLKLL